LGYLHAHDLRIGIYLLGCAHLTSFIPEDYMLGRAIRSVKGGGLSAGASGHERMFTSGFFRVRIVLRIWFGPQPGSDWPVCGRVRKTGRLCAPPTARNKNGIFI